MQFQVILAGAGVFVEAGEGKTNMMVIHRFKAILAKKKSISIPTR